MARVEYSRSDLVVAFRRVENRTYLVRVIDERGGVEAAISLDDPGWHEPIAERIGLWDPPGSAMIRRVLLRSCDTGIDALPLEELLGLADVQDRVVLRDTQVMPRSRDLHFSLPLRVIEVGEPGGRSLLPNVRTVFGQRSDEAVSLAFKHARMTLGELDHLPPAEWPTVDIVHFTGFPFGLLWLFSKPFPLDSGLIEPLPWLLRFTDHAQTRLVIFECAPADAAAARELAGALTRRGGPAAIIVESGLGHGLENLFWEIVHDKPLDAAVAGLPARLFAGAGREEALRISTLGLGLLELGYALEAFERPSARQGDAAPADSGPLFAEDAIIIERASRRKGYQRLRPDLIAFKGDWESYAFDMHEGDGLLPMSERLEAMRVEHHLTKPISFEHVPTIQIRPTPCTNRPPRAQARHGMVLGSVVPKTRKRFLNASLWTPSHANELSRVQPSDGIVSDRIYQLGVQIGPRDKLTIALGAVAIFEPVFKWEEAKRGEWVQVCVTGLDFQVLGDPIQELWLPRKGQSATAYFPIRSSRRAGAARIRIGLFFRNQLVQSIRLAAVVTEAGELIDAAKRVSLLAAALGPDAGPLPSWAGHATRLEYSLGLPVEDLTMRADRAVTIVANDLDGTSVVSVKVGEDFETRSNADTPDYVQLVRDAMHDVSFPPQGPVPSEDDPYAFVEGGVFNAGSTEQLKKNLGQLADSGWTLYNEIIPSTVRTDLSRELATDGRVIHVAHILLEKAIPWAALYDRQYDPHMAPEDATYDACLAALGPDGSLKPMTCGSDPGCPLHTDNIAKVTAAGSPAPVPKSVACVRHFWGFRHQIEMPAQQVKGAAADARPQSLTVSATGTLQLTAALNLMLPRATQHQKDLDALASLPALSATWRSKESKRAKILKALEEQELHLIYFYCHARGGKASPDVKVPRLEFQHEKTSPVELITSADLTATDPWRHGPFVILNACGTAGFSPEALSPFIRTLVQDRGASGVIGTEIAVSDVLAGEVAVEFLKSFLDTATAGEAMQRARLHLLGMNNPLGLVYALYAAADLKLKR